MRRALLGLSLIIALTAPVAGCVSYLESMYDNEARANCDRASRSIESCYDRVDRERRERRRAAGE